MNDTLVTKVRRFLHFTPFGIFGITLRTWWDDGCVDFVWLYIYFGATRGVTVSMSAFLACHQGCCAGSSLA